MKTFYTEYVHHCMRFYVKYPNPKYRSDADKHNWIACDTALKGFSETDRELLLTLYTGNEPMAERIRKVSTEQDVKADALWKMVTELERKIAKRRGLL